jgi:hypothetical protein
MATDPLANSWTAYRRAVDGFYDVARGALSERRQLIDTEADNADAALARIVRCAEELEVMGAQLLPNAGEQERERITTLLLAAAASDFAIASDALWLDSDRPVADDQLAQAAAAMQAIINQRIVADADEAFGFGRGAEAMRGEQRLEEDQERLRRLCEVALHAMVDVAYDPALSFGLGAITAGAGTVAGLAGLHAPDQLTQIANRVGRIKRHAVRLAASGIRKMICITGLNAMQVIQRAIDFLEGEALEALARRVKEKLARLLGGIARRPRAEQEILEEITAVQPMPGDAISAALKDFQPLQRDHRDQMRWMSQIAEVISFASPLISTIGAPAGPLVVAGMDAIGLGCVILLLRGKIAHVPMIVGRRLLPGAN